MTDWNILNQLGRSYLDIQKTRVAMELRCQRLEEQELIRKKLAKEEYTYRDEDQDDNEDDTLEDTDSKNHVRIRKVTPLHYNDKAKQKKLEEKIKKVLTAFREKNESFKLILSHKGRLNKQEKDLLSDSVKLFESTNLWKWCEITRGLGEVAAMTFVSYINPDKAKTVANMWSYLGLTPNQLRRKGQQSNFNAKIKSRFLGVICQNIIRANDSYYATIYRIKKQYYRERPDILVRKKAGFNAWTDKMAKRILAKLLVSHAYEILQRDRGIMQSDESITDRHRNPIPIKTEDIDEQQEVLTRYLQNHALLLERLKKLWIEDESENKEKYFEYMQHADMSNLKGDL